jgi:hypothetical protein
VTEPAPRPRPRRRKRLVPSWVVTSLLVLLVFLLGIALGQALHDNPKPGGTQTIVQTFTP